MTGVHPYYLREQVHAGTWITFTPDRLHIYADNVSWHASRAVAEDFARKAGIRFGQVEPGGREVVETEPGAA